MKKRQVKKINSIKKIIKTVKYFRKIIKSNHN